MATQDDGLNLVLAELRELRAQIAQALATTYEAGGRDERHDLGYTGDGDPPVGPTGPPTVEPPPGARRKRHLWLVPVVALVVWSVRAARGVRRQVVPTLAGASAMAVAAATFWIVTAPETGGDPDVAGPAETTSHARDAHSALLASSPHATTAAAHTSRSRIGPSSHSQHRSTEDVQVPLPRPSSHAAAPSTRASTHPPARSQRSDPPTQSSDPPATGGPRVPSTTHPPTSRPSSQPSDSASNSRVRHHRRCLVKLPGRLVRVGVLCHR